MEDLSKNISGAELTDADREIIAPESESDVINPAAFDIEFFAEENK